MMLVVVGGGWRFLGLLLMVVGVLCLVGVFSVGLVVFGGPWWSVVVLGGRWWPLVVCGVCCLSLVVLGGFWVAQRGPVWFLVVMCCRWWFVCGWLVVAAAFFFGVWRR